MPQLLVRNINESLVRKLKRRALLHGVSAEEEHRRILKETLSARRAKKRTLMDFLLSDDAVVHPEVELMHASHRHCISAITIGEIRKGIELLRLKSPQQCPAFESWLANIKTEFSGQVLDITEEIAERWGALMAKRPRPAIDGYLAATALEHGLKIVTRNTADFADSGVAVINPWE